MDVQELNNLGPGFLIVDEPDYSRERLLEFQRKYDINTLELFEHLKNFGTAPIGISERELTLWEHYLNIFLTAEGEPWDLLEYDDETLCGQALEEGDTNPPLLLRPTFHGTFPTGKWCSTWACK